MTKKEMQMQAVKIKRIFKNVNPPIDGTTFDAALQAVNGELCAVCEFIQGTPEEALVFLTLLASNSKYGIPMKHIDDFLSMEHGTSALFLSEAVDALSEKLLVKENDYHAEGCFYLTSFARKMAEKGLSYKDIMEDIIKERRTLRHLSIELDKAIWDNMDSDIAKCERRVFKCLFANTHWGFVNRLLDVNDQYSPTEWVLFVWVMIQQTYSGEATVDIEHYLTSYAFGQRTYFQNFASTQLGKSGYISSNEALWTNRIKITITLRAWAEFLSDEFPFMRLVVEGPALKEVDTENIARRRLFYNSDLEGELNTLVRIMKLGKFEEFSNRQSRKGQKGRLTILFDGPPGTGKTEFVHQLAVKTGRLLMMVDIAEIRSKWVGDSEKNIAAIFNDYRRAKESNGYAPIMMLDEADAIISRRFGVNNSIDQMNNTIQNLLLQYIERMEGILIATTNLRGNMDSAFERRFLMKLKFTYPDNETRMRILKDKLGLDNSDAEAIASSYSFTGADIENVVQKLSMMKFLGKRINNDVIIQQLHQDLQSASGRNSIGFKF